MNASYVFVLWISVFLALKYWKFRVRIWGGGDREERGEGKLWLWLVYKINEKMLFNKIKKAKPKKYCFTVKLTLLVDKVCSC